MNPLIWNVFKESPRPGTVPSLSSPAHREH